MVEPVGGWRIVGNISNPEVARQFPAIDRVRGQGAGARIAGSGDRLGGAGDYLGLKREFIPFGVGGEIEAGVNATVDYVAGKFGGDGPSWANLYDEYLDISRGDQARTREKMPVLSTVAGVAGALTTGPGSMLTGATTAVGRVGGAAAIGAAQGAAYGFGEGEGGFLPRLDNALGSAGTGAALGGALSGFAELVGRLARGVAYVKGLQGPGADGRAQQMVVDALKADGIDPATLASRARAGKPLTIADLGENTRALLGSAVRQGGDARTTATNFLEQRTRGQFGRLVQDTAAGTGVHPTDFAGTTASTAARRAANAKTGYPAAYAQPAPALSERAQAILNTPAGKRALETAEDFLAHMDNGAGGFGKPMRDANGNLTVEALDYVQRALADQIGEAKVGLAGTKAANRTNLRDALIQELPDDLRNVMRNYATESEILDSLEAGRKFMSGDAEALGKDISKLAPKAQEAFRLGVARQLMEMMGRKSSTADASTIFQNPAMASRLSKVFGSRRLFQDFMERAQAEATMQGTRNAVLKGSQTAPRMADDAAFSGGVLGDAASDVLGGSSLTTTGVRAVINAASSGKARLLDGLNKAVAKNVADMATNPDLAGVAQRLGASTPQLPAVVSTPLGRGVQAGTGRAAGQVGSQTQQPERPSQPMEFEGWKIIREPQAERMNAPAVPEPVERVTQAAMTDSRPVAPIVLARAFTGKTEGRDARVLSRFMERFGGSKIDPAVTPWCAAFVNAVLGASGSQGTGRLNARSFLEWGEPAKEPQIGDVAVFTRGDPNGWQGHVGFFAGYTTQNGRRMVRVVGGNQDNSVSEKLYPADKLLGFRRPASSRSA